MAKQEISTRFMEMLNGSMTVESLIAELELLPPNALVCIQHNYGDVGNTQELLAVNEVIEFDAGSQRLEETAYSASHVEVVELDEVDDLDDDELAENEEDFEGIELVILRT